MAAKFVVLTYHRVLDKHDPLDPLTCDRAMFASQLNVLQRFFNVVPLPDAVRLSHTNDLPGRAVCVTFDDGYRDNFDNALPMLQAAGIDATFFIATGYLNDGIMWNDRLTEAVRRRADGPWDLSDAGLGLRQVNGMTGRRTLLEELIRHLKHMDPQHRDQLAQELYRQGGGSLGRIMMTDDEVRGLAHAQMGIGAHTVTHPILNRVPDAAALAEMTDGRRQLQDLTAQDVNLFAYPNGKPGGDYDQRHAQMADEAGFAAAFSTQWGYAGPAAPAFEQPRVSLEDERGWRFAAKLAKAFWEPRAAL